MKMAKFSKRVENTVGKVEIARHEQFLLFPQCFQKTCTADTLKPGLVWERVKCRFQQYFSYIAAADESIHAFLEFPF